MARPRVGEPPLDDADLRIIQLLTAQGRLPNRAIATEIGLTEATVAARIRSLVGRGVLGVTATIDWYAAGFDWDAWIDAEFAASDTDTRRALLARVIDHATVLPYQGKRRDSSRVQVDFRT